VFQDILPQNRALLHFAVQLQSFLINGSILRDGSQPANQKASAEMWSMEPAFRFSLLSCNLKTVRALSSGAKLLAVLCETTGKLGFLRNSVYLVLRFSDLDSQCLLAILSSFACVDCKKFLSVDDGDIVGKAVHVVISELTYDAEVQRQSKGCLAEIDMIQCDRELQQGPVKEAEELSDLAEFQQNLKALQDVKGIDDSLTFETYVPKLVELFNGVITPSTDLHLLDNRHLFQKSLRIITCNEAEQENLIAASLLNRNSQGLETSTSTELECSFRNRPTLRIEEKKDDNSHVEEYCWRFLQASSSTQSMNQSERDAEFLTKWELRFYDICNALELVSKHLGWEWTYNDFIVDHLWKLVSPGAHATTVACVAHMFGLLGRLGKEVDNTDLPGVDELRKSLLVVLNADQPTGSGHSFSFRAQVAAAQSLLVLSSLNRKDGIYLGNDPETISADSSELHAKSVKSVWNWVRALKLEIEEIVPSSLRAAFLSVDQGNFVLIR
jgi:hypothetical protein